MQVSGGSYGFTAPRLSPVLVSSAATEQHALGKAASASLRSDLCWLQVSGGFYGFTAPRPSLVLVSSAATERNALIGDDAEARKADIPIVQLNPGALVVVFSCAALLSTPVLDFLALCVRHKAARFTVSRHHGKLRGAGCWLTVLHTAPQACTCMRRAALQL